MPLEEPYLRDTVNVAYWDGQSREYPRVKLRMDFRDKRIVGMFPTTATSSNMRMEE